ncbi:MAG: hypothetical protein AAFU65_09070, partial [Pseudomonadota bacterium]
MTESTSKTNVESIQDPHRLRRETLRAEIALFLRRRRIEATAAASLLALSTYSQAYALSISEINVQSALGQPLRASIDIGVTPGEIINSRCVRIRPPADGGMPGVGRVSLALTSKLNTVTLRLNGSAPMREPLSEMVVTIDCAGTPTMTRSFLVLLDPPSPISAAVPGTAGVTSATAAPAPVARATAAPASRSQPARTAPRAAARSARGTGGPSEAGSRYVVQPGDILSVIASRVANRPDYSVWPIAQRIYDTNPEAFDSQAPDSLRVGATLDIPQLVGNLAVAGTPQQTRRVRARTARVDAAQPRRVAASAPAPNRSTNRSKDTALVDPVATPTTARAQRLANAPRRSPVALPRTLDTFAISGNLSALSIDRLRKRQLGKPVVTALPTETALPPTDAIARREDGATVGARTGEATDTATQATETTAAATRTATPEPVFTNFDDVPVRRGLPGWMVGLAALVGAALGGAFTLFGLRGWLASKRSEQEEAIARAKRHEQRLEESRRQRPSNEAPAIVVKEQPRVDIGSARNIETVGSVDEVLASAPDSAAIGAMIMADQNNAVAHDASPSYRIATDESTLTVDAIEDEDEDELNFNVFDEPDESALELLAQDYEQSEDTAELTPDPAATALLSPEQLGITEEDTTQMLRGALDLELPEGSPDDTVMAVAGVDNLPDMPQATDDELTEAALQLNEDLLNITPAANRSADDADNDPTSESPILSDEAGQDDDPTTAFDTRGTEDYYHLEASSIRK